MARRQGKTQREQMRLLVLDDSSACYDKVAQYCPLLLEAGIDPTIKYPNIFSENSIFGRFSYFVPSFAISVIAIGAFIACFWLPEQCPRDATRVRPLQHCLRKCPSRQDRMKCASFESVSGFGRGYAASRGADWTAPRDDGATGGAAASVPRDPPHLVAPVAPPPAVAATPVTAIPPTHRVHQLLFPIGIHEALFAGFGKGLLVWRELDFRPWEVFGHFGRLFRSQGEFRAARD
uniref:Uncharacterized protein n=1 Tax=Ananas comosus var. bracteatus TaxID=296719 RepID=A0A6V7Q9A8_ANACO|nr:unnamed protein product [Ananas comosus var. bracteatus]